MGRHVDALADYEKAIHLKPDYAAAYNNRGTAKGALGRYEAAITDFDEAIRLNLDDAVAYTNRGLVKKALGLKEEARTDFKTALELARKSNNTAVIMLAKHALRDLGPDEGS